MKLTVYHYDAFTDKPGMGNPAGIILHADTLTEEQMLAAAAAVGFNETAFILAPSDAGNADIRFRFFTPGQEMTLCGHATVASSCLLSRQGMLPDGTVHVETGAGILPVSVLKSDGKTLIGMQQAAYEEEAFEGSPAALMAAIGLTEDDLDKDLPIVYGSTGNWTLLVPIRTLAAFQRMKPENRLFPEILSKHPRASVHPFCTETVHPEADLHGRHFSSPFSGTVEDPVTGTASGVMGAYWQKYGMKVARGADAKKSPAAIDASAAMPEEILVEQGQDMGRDGLIRVRLPKGDAQPVMIFGTAVPVREFEIEI